MKQISLKIFVIVLIAITGCKKNNNSVTNPHEELLSPSVDSLQTFSINNFSVQLDSLGRIQNGTWSSDSGIVGVIYRAGLWIGIQQDGSPHGDIIWDGTSPSSNYTSNWNNRRLGVFYLDAASSYSPSHWPVEYGAPVTSSGTPRVFGDAMCWSALTSDTSLFSTPILSKPIHNIRVTQALYAYKRSDLQTIIFVRYEITNSSSEKWDGIYIGFYSDTDLGYYPPNNRTGYDSIRGLTYTYVDSLNGTAYSLATGFSFLETPKNIGTTSHRIMRKNNYINPDFGEASFTSPQQILYALQGLSNSGLPMINPTTGLSTLFAFAGDPVTGAGWLDTPVDVRSMISSGPFSLGAYETQKVSIVWAVNDGTNIADALTKLKIKIDQVKTNTTLWQFN